MKWKLKIIYVDVETGEVLNQWWNKYDRIQEEYEIIKQTKKFTHNGHSTTGTLTLTNAVRRKTSTQLRINWDDRKR